MKNRRRLILGSISILTTFPIVISTSATENENSDSGSENNEGSEENNKQIDPKFDSFEKVVDSILKERLSTLIDQKISDLRTKANDILKKKGISETQELIKAIYYQKVADFLYRNREDILDNPSEFGFHITYPYVLALNKDIYVANVVYDNQEITNVKFGTIGKTTYFEDGITIKNNNNFTRNLNTTSIEDLKIKTNEYIEELNTDFDSIFVNDNDVPTLKVDSNAVNSNKDVTGMLFDDFLNGFEITLPSGYESWDDYIKSKFEKRFIGFDIRTNSKEEQPEEQPEEPTPIIPDSKAIPLDDPFENDGNVTENVPSLNPYISYEYFDADYDTLIELAKTNPTSLDKYFKFDNPIFTRYGYSVTSIHKDSESSKLIASVIIRDLNNLSVARSYDIEVNKFESKEYTKIKEIASNIVKETYSKFYDALGISSKITFKNLGNQDLILSVFNMVVATNKLITQNNEYTAKYEEILNNYKDQVNETSEVVSPNFKTQLLNLFLGSLDRSNLQAKNDDINYGYYEYLWKTYKDFLKDYIASVSKTANREIIIENFKNFGFDTKTFDKAINITKEDLNYWFGLINSDTFDIQEKFNKNNDVIKKIQSTLTELGVLARPEILKKDEAESTEIVRFGEAYEKIKNITPIGYVKKKKTLYQILSAIFGIISLVTLSAWVFLHFSKNKKMKLNKKYSFILIGATVLMLSITILMIVLSIGGL